MQTILPILSPATFALLLIVERLFAARPLPKVRGWFLKGMVFYVMTSLMAAAIPAMVASTASAFALLDLRGLGTVGGALVAFVVAELVGYWVHRLKHRVTFIWRWTHQLHHSAERVDLLGLSYFHPFDFATMIGAGALATALLGVGPEAGALAGFINFVSAAFGHLNVRTPRWLGYIVQRPENHAVHHARGVHGYNYANLALWDIVFGTFRNPADHPEKAGFWDGASGRVSAMLFGRDVSEPPAHRMTEVRRADELAVR